MRFSLAAAILIVIAGCQLTSQTQETTQMLASDYAVRPAEDITVDGILDEDCWGTRFISLRKTIAGEQAGEAPEQKTEVALLWQPEALYVGWKVWDADIVATHTERDQPVYGEDCVEAFIDANEDLHDYAEIELSPRNVIFDGWATKEDWKKRPANIDKEWNVEGLRTATHVKGGFWSAEMYIPAAEIRQKQTLSAGHIAPREVWELNLYRIDYNTANEKVEYQSWGVFAEGWFHQPVYFRTVQFIE